MKSKVPQEQTKLFCELTIGLVSCKVSIENSFEWIFSRIIVHTMHHSSLYIKYDSFGGFPMNYVLLFHKSWKIWNQECNIGTTRDWKVQQWSNLFPVWFIGNCVWLWIKCLFTHWCVNGFALIHYKFPEYIPIQWGIVNKNCVISWTYNYKILLSSVTIRNFTTSCNPHRKLSTMFLTETVSKMTDIDNWSHRHLSISRQYC